MTLQVVYPPQVEHDPPPQEEQPPPPELLGFWRAPATPNTENKVSRFLEPHFEQVSSSSSDFLNTRNSNEWLQSLHKNSLSGMFRIIGGTIGVSSYVERFLSGVIGVCFDGCLPNAGQNLDPPVVMEFAVRIVHLIGFGK